MSKNSKFQFLLTLFTVFFLFFFFCKFHDLTKMKNNCDFQVYALFSRCNEFSQSDLILKRLKKSLNFCYQNFGLYQKSNPLNSKLKT